MALEPMIPFVWGTGGSQLTPDQIASHRKVAQAMLDKGGDYSPVQSWSQGAARVAQAIFGGMMAHDANEAAKANQKAESDLLTGIFSGGGSTSAATASAPPAPTATASVSTPMGATSIPAGKDEFVNAVMPLAQEASAKTGIDPRIIVAQAALESGWGKSAPGNNLFGIKSHGAPGGNVLPTTEIVNGQPVQTTDSFRAFASPADSVSGYSDFMLNNPRYAPVRSAQGVDAQIAALGQSGYATDPNYAAKIGSIVKTLPAPAAPQSVETGDQPSPLDTAQFPAGPVGAPGTQTAEAAPTSAAVPQAVPATPQAAPGVNPALLRAMSSPYVSDGTKKILGLVLSQQMEAAKNAADPLRQLQIANARKTLNKPDAPNSVQEYEYYTQHFQPTEQQPKPMSYDVWSTAKARAAATTINNNVGTGETSFQKEAGKAQAQRFNDLVEEGAKGKQMLADVQTLTDLGNNINTGKIAEAKAAIGPYAQALGIKVDGLSDIQAYEAIVNRVAPTLRVKGSGAQSDYELKNFLKSLPSLGNTPEGNDIAAAVMNGLQQNKVLAGEIASKAMNGEITKAEADKQLRELPDPMIPYREYQKARKDAAPAKMQAPSKSDIEAEMKRRGLL